MNPEIPQLLTLALPLIVTPLAGWLSHAKLAVWLNTLIVVAVVFGADAAWALYVHSFTPNIIEDFIILNGYTAALMAGPLKGLYSYATLNWASPLSFLAPKPAPIVPLTRRASLFNDFYDPDRGAMTIPTASVPSIPLQEPGEQGSTPRLPDAPGD